jgi:Domain of unknown function (DUF929)
MSSTRPKSGSNPGKSKGISSRAKKAASGGATKKTAASARFAERQARKEEVAREARRTRNRRYALGSIALVALIVAVVVIVKVSGGGSGSGNNGSGDVASPPAGTPVAASTLAKIASVPISTLAAAPSDGIINEIQPVTGSPLVSDGKPDMLFIGAEYCPHCAAERWALYIALSKFGTFSPSPGRIHSANLDGDVPTLTFYGTTYSSPYFTFTPVEVYTNTPQGSGYAPLQTPTRSQANLWQSVGGGNFPFVDFGGKEALSGAQFDFSPLQNLPFDDVAAQVGNNSTQIGANINASAYRLIGAMCRSLSSHQPTAVCSAANA